jgi:hypothetical protein
MQARERILAGAVALLIGGWLVDTVVVQPAVAWFAAVDQQTRDATREAGEARALVDRQARIVADWRARHAAGLLDDQDQARFRLQRALSSGAQGSGFVLDSVSGGQLVPAAQEQHYDLLRLTVSGHGALAQVQAFIAGLESAAMPLAIERCELSAGDPRKDQLDAALTVSTRIVAPAARGGRAVPDGIAAWVPATRDGALDAAVLAAKPFLTDRRGSRNETAISVPAAGTVPATSGPTPAAAGSSPGWALVGIVAFDQRAVAFLRHQGDGSERQLAAGEQLAGGTVLAIDARGLRLGLADGGERLIEVGHDLAGDPIAGAPLPARSLPGATGSGSTAAGGTTTAATVPGTSVSAPFQVPTITVDPEREAILQRLRQQRNRTP